MASVTDYENLYAKLMKAFGKAMDRTQSSKWGDEKAILLTNQAFDLAQKHGWDWENDEKWMHWANKATEPEIIAHGLAYAIQKCEIR